VPIYFLPGRSGEGNPVENLIGGLFCPPPPGVNMDEVVKGIVAAHFEIPVLDHVLHLLTKHSGFLCIRPYGFTSHNALYLNSPIIKINYWL